MRSFPSVADVDGRGASYGESVAGGAVEEQLDAYRGVPTLEEAERVLREVERSEGAGEVSVGDLYDNLAEVAADEGDFALAVRAQRRALQLGSEMPVLGREMLGWYLMKDGQRLAGEAEFEALRSELGNEPELLVTLGNARSDAGDEWAALEAFDQALAAAKERGDRDTIDRARVERRGCREELGLPSDADDLRGRPRPRFAPSSRQVRIAVGWFPREELAAALGTWPELDGDLGDADGYCSRFDARLRELLGVSGRRPVIAPLRVRELIEYADREGLDPSDASTRAGLAVELDRRGETVAWPPARNEPCWCGSGRKYKRCCAA